MYVLYGAPPAFSASHASPFSLKAHHLVTLAGVPFRFEGVNPTRGPRKKIPWLTCPDGTVIADTRNIQRHLAEHAGLTLGDSGRTERVRRVVEEHLYWAQMYFRWAHHPDEVRDELFGEVPWPLREVVVGVVRRQVRRDPWGQGLGRRPETEIVELVKEDLDMLEDALGDGPFFGGDTLATADLSCQALLEQLLPTSFEDPLILAVRRRPRLVEHHRRVADAVTASRSTPCSTPS